MVVAGSAAIMSMVSAAFVPQAQPWASLAWAVLACAGGVLAFQEMLSPTPRMSDVIRDVEAEPAIRVVRGCGSTETGGLS
jgi:hypothetical protein